MKKVMSDLIPQKIIEKGGGGLGCNSLCDTHNRFEEKKATKFLITEWFRHF